MVSKRAAAIVGPTPETLYWAIEHPCPWRKPHEKSPAVGPFRDLRALRELSLALTENRVESGIALHRRTAQKDESTILGFVVAEVEQVYGGRDLIEQSCGSCTANATRTSGGWAGCYGWLPLWTNHPADDITETESHESSSLHNLIDQVILQTESQAEFRRNFVFTKPSWYGLWMRTPWNPEQVSLGAKILSQVLRELKAAPFDFPSTSLAIGERTVEENLQALIDALNVAAQADLPIHFELIPAGFSDGITWSLPTYCGRCRAKRTEKTCRCCGVTGDLQPGQRRRVLGLRPYLRLAEIVGLDAAEDLASRYRNRKGGE